MGARHVSQLGSLLKAEAGKRYFVIEAGAKQFAIFNREGTAVRHVEGFDVNEPSRKYDLRSTLTMKSLAGMSIQSLPGCCGVCVLHSFSGEVKHITEFIKSGIRAAKRAGYGMVLFTLRSDSGILGSFLEAEVPASYTINNRLDFRNGKTNNTVTTVTINLTQPERTAQRNDTAGE